MITLPTISLWQPHASLLFVKDEALRKHNETRVGRLPDRCRGVRVAIHATLKMPTKLPEGLPNPHQIAVEAFGWDYRQSLPRGAVIGTVIFTDCISSEMAKPATEADRMAGDWSAGRFIWPVSDARLFPAPIPTKGQQGWFKVQIDDGCSCFRCTSYAAVAEGWPLFDPRWHRMFLCETCGNKRCPHAADHRLTCSGSNEPGQKGSLYEDAPAPCDRGLKPLVETEGLDAKHESPGARSAIAQSPSAEGTS